MLTGREIMVDKITFMETLHSVQEIAKASPVPMTKEEITSYFQDMDLSEEQQEMIVQFLQMTQEETPEEAVEETESQTGEGSAGPETKSGAKAGASKGSAKKAGNPHFNMYLREISSVPKLTKEQKNLLYQRLLQGDGTAAEELSHQWLKKVIRIAETYVTPQVFLEDLVQEGNIGLLLGLRQLTGKADAYGMGENSGLKEAQQKQLEKHLEESVREGMEQYRQELMGEADSEKAILAKVSLIHEARKALAEENGTDPTVQELCEYTRISAEEIAGILNLHEK